MITLSLTNGNSIIVPIPKKGNSPSHDNQRGIAKRCAFAKLTNKLLLARMRNMMEPQLLGVQSGFRAGRSTVAQTIALRHILDMSRVSKRMTTTIFIDFIRHLIPFIDVLFHWYCQSMAYQRLSLPMYCSFTYGLLQ